MNPSNDQTESIAGGVIVAVVTSALLAAMTLLVAIKPCGCRSTAPAAAVPDLAEHSIVVRRE